MIQKKIDKVIARNTRCYPSETGEYVEIRVVLVAGQIGDYAAYVGHGTDEFVTRLGNKLSFEEACIHFPIGLERERYRD